MQIGDKMSVILRILLGQIYRNTRVCYTTQFQYKSEMRILEYLFRVSWANNLNLIFQIKSGYLFQQMWHHYQVNIL